MSVLACVFDLDGVLIDSERMHLESWRRALAERDIELEEKWFHIGVGMLDMEFYRLMAEEKGFDPDDAAMLHRKAEIMREMMAREIPSCAGAETMLRLIRDRMPAGVATSSSRAYLDMVLDVKGWGDYFDITLSRDDVENRKPAPDIYLNAAEALCAEPNHCFAIEDSPTGLESARAADFHTVAVTTNFPAEKLEPLADLVVDSLNQWERIFEFFQIEHSKNPT